MPAQSPSQNLLGRDVTSAIPASFSSDTPLSMPAPHQRIWELAKAHLAVRSNDVHTLYSYAIAATLTRALPESDPEVVLPAILLHDTGWSKVDSASVLEAIAPDGGDLEPIYAHEREGALIAAQVLEEVGHDVERTAEVVTIVDGHDTRREALSLNDMIVKDADKLWRYTPHGIDTVMDWFGLSRGQAHRLVDDRVQGRLYLEESQMMARALSAVCWVDALDERVSLAE